MSNTSQLDIKIRALIQGLAELNQLADSLKNTGGAADEAGKKAKDGAGGLESLKNGVSSTDSPIKTLKGELKDLIGLFAALAVAYGLKESADYAARTEVLGTTLNVVGKNAGYSGAQLNQYEDQVKHLGITTQATREAMIEMIQAGLELGPAAAGQVAQVGRLARAAQDLAVVTGESSSATLTRLITNISQLDTVGLRYMGLTVDVAAAEERFALSLGKTSDQLTNQQKIQAVANAALQEAEKLTGSYEASLQNVGKQLQSIKRYQDELANDIGQKLLPAYYELVKAATDFLKTADQTVKQTDKNGEGAKALAEGSKAFFSGLGDLFNAVLYVGSEITPTFEKVLEVFLELLGDIGHGTAEILQLGDTIDATGRRTSALGQAINDTILIPLGILIAGLKDGLLFIAAVFAGLAGAAQYTAGIIIEGWGQIVKLFDKDLGDAIQSSGKALRDNGKSLLGFAGDVVDKFSKGESALGKFNAKLEESKARTEALAKASTYGEIEEQIRKLTEAKRKSTLTDVELQKAADQVADTIKRLGSETDEATGKTKLSEAQVRQLGVALTSISRDSAQQFTDAINDMGLKLVKLGSTQYLVPLSKDFEKASGDVLKLAENAKTTGIEFQQAFAKGLDATKTLTDIASLSASLKNASNAGKDLGDSGALIVGQFEKVFATSLKAADTKLEFALLTAQVKDLGDKGVISGALVAKALDDIKEKSTGARAESALLAHQLTEVGKSAVDIAKAHLGVVQAEYEVGHARIAVWQAQNKYAQDGSDLSREELRLAQLNLQLAQAKAVEAKLAYAEAQQNGKVLIAQQEQILATKRLERDLDNQDLILAKDAADKRLEAENAAYEKAKQQSEAQAQVTVKIEESVYQQKLAVEQAQALADQTKQAAGHASSVASSAGAAANNLDAAATGANALNNGLAAAGSSAQTLTTALANATAEQSRLAAAISATAAAQERLDAAQGSNFGGDLGDGGLAARNASVKARTGAQTQQDYTISAEQGRYNAYLAGHGSLTEADRAYVQSTYDAAQANLVVAQRYSSAFSLDGLAAANAAARAAQGALNSLNAPRNTARLSNQLLSSLPQSSAGSGINVPNASINQASVAAPSKVVQVNFTNTSGQSVPATIDAAHESDLLAMLAKAKGVA